MVASNTNVHWSSSAAVSLAMFFAHIFTLFIGDYKLEVIWSNSHSQIVIYHGWCLFLKVFLKSSLFSSEVSKAIWRAILNTWSTSLITFSLKYPVRKQLIMGASSPTQKNVLDLSWIQFRCVLLFVWLLIFLQTFISISLCFVWLNKLQAIAIWLSCISFVKLFQKN